MQITHTHPLPDQTILTRENRSGVCVVHTFYVHVKCVMFRHWCAFMYFLLFCLVSELFWGMRFASSVSIGLGMWSFFNSLRV